MTAKFVYTCKPINSVHFSVDHRPVVDIRSIYKKSVVAKGPRSMIVLKSCQHSCTKNHIWNSLH